MTTGNTDPKSTPVASDSLRRSVLVAGLLGGLLGAVFSFVLARALPGSVKPPPSPPPSEARQFADHVLGKLKAGQNDEFMAFLRPAFERMTDEQFAQFRQGVFDGRAGAAKSFGPGGEFEVCREAVLSPTLVRITYLEKYTRGCLLWSFVVYNAPDGWRVAAFSVHGPETGFTELQ
jgi:hypothetical protein